MMNGLLLSEGYPAINLPAKRQLDLITSCWNFIRQVNRNP